MPPPPPPPPPAAQAPAEQTTVESEFVVILAALLCAVICILGLFAVARCSIFRRNTAAASSSAASNKGLKKKTIRSLPRFTYSASAGSSKRQGDGDVEDRGTDNDDGNDNNECAICLAEFVDGEEIRVLPQCGHGFHVTCVDTWLGKHSSCPKCRRVLVVGKKCGSCIVSTAEGAKRTCTPGTSIDIGIGDTDFLP